MSRRWWRAQREPRPPAMTGVETALRTVLVVTLSYDEAEFLADGKNEENVCSLWPSTLYRFLAAKMLACPESWGRGAEKLDYLLANWLRRYERYSPAEIVEAVSCTASYDALHLAALLWSLIRRRERALEPLLVRITAEVDVAVYHLASGNRTQRWGAQH